MYSISLGRVLETFNLFTFDAITDGKDKRSLAASFDCRQKKPLCNANAACTAHLRDEKRYICVCNNGFEGNGTTCRGVKAFETHFNLQLSRLSSFRSNYYFHLSLVQLAK